MVLLVIHFSSVRCVKSLLPMVLLVFHFSSVRCVKSLLITYGVGVSFL